MERSTRRTFLKHSGALGAGIVTAGSSAHAHGQDATPVATPVVQASPAVMPPAEEGATIFDTNLHRAIMSYNIAHASDLERWEARKHILSEQILSHRPVLIGMQEVLQIEHEYFERALAAYDFVGVSRQGNDEDEYNPIYFDTDRVQIEESGTFWLSDTPDEPATMLAGEGHPRICTWLRCIIDGRPNAVYMFNTHLSYDEVVVARQVEVLLAQVELIVDPSLEIVMTGDFNRPRASHVWKMFKDAGFTDNWELADTETGPSATFHQWRGLDATGGFEQNVVGDDADFQIDWVLYRGGDVDAITEPLLVQVDPYHVGDVYPSDHYPVILTTLGRPEFAATDLRVSAEEVVAHDPIEVTATLTNSGYAGTAEVLCYFDRAVVDSQWITLNGDQSTEVTFDSRLYAPGEHEVSIDLLPSEVINVLAAPTQLVYGSMESEPYAQPGDPVTFTTVIDNQGSFTGTAETDFYVDDVLIDSASTVVGSGLSEEVGFVYTFDDPGAYEVVVGSQTFSVSVIESLPGAWQFMRGDDLEWAEPDLDTSDWEETELPAPWEQHADYTEDFVYGWYRLSVEVPADWEGNSVRFVLGQIDDADKTYLNGELIGETGSFPDDAAGVVSEWNVMREYDAPADLVEFGAENVIAIRVYDDLGGGGLHSGPLGMLPVTPAG